MKKGFVWIIAILVMGTTIGFIIYKGTNKAQNVPHSSNYQSSKTSKEKNTYNEEQIKNNNNSVYSKETEIATFTTKIREKSSNRQNNITLACSTLNDTIVEPETTFSFCDTLGKATEEKGYKKASIFKDGIEIQGFGGGKCQISSTLYNAVLQREDLEVIERHAHSGKVYYVPEGKDAAVSFGTYDFKFKNHTGKKLKIKSSCTKSEITIKLLLLE